MFKECLQKIGPGVLRAACQVRKVCLQLMLLADGRGFQHGAVDLTCATGLKDRAKGAELATLLTVTNILMLLFRETE